ncbi:MAG: cell division topological specificity factor MinE [Kistimonas sp.]|nr:cell division topological specificity factor MinE [Kistimonas sp.]
MSLRDILRPKPPLDTVRAQRKGSSAAVARERLQVVVTHERNHRGGGTFCIPTLQQEILAVVRRHVGVHQDQVCVKIATRQNISRLEVSVALPESNTPE